MKTIHQFFRLLAAAALLMPAISIAANDVAALADHVWIHGAEDCAKNSDPAIETFKFDEDTYILRQNKCVSAEAPFIYVLFGSHTVLVQDTGATPEAEKFPLYDTVLGLIGKRPSGQDDALKILVTHSHNHSDHNAADGQFQGKPNVTVVAPTKQGLNGFLASLNAPLGTEKAKSIDLGGREITIFAIPGHQSDSVAVYDARTKWLLTGDAVYPGIISVLDWKGYFSSIDRLVQFAATHEVSAVLGSHIEMSKTPGVPYERGTVFQPNEAGLALPASALNELKASLDNTGGKHQEVISGSIIVREVPWAARMLIRALKAE
jgi:hydroxyacylglutathione hydrolase